MVFSIHFSLQKSKNDNSWAWNECDKLRVWCDSDISTFGSIQNSGIFYVEATIEEYLNCDVNFTTSYVIHEKRINCFKWKVIAWDVSRAYVMSRAYVWLVCPPTNKINVYNLKKKNHFQVITSKLQAIHLCGF